MTCLKKIQNTEVFGSKFSSRTLTTAGDISDYSFKAVVKNIIQGKILEIPGIKNAGTINFDFSQLQTLKKSTYNIEYWGDFGALGNEPFLLEELSIVSAENATNCTNSDNLNFEIKIEEINIPVTITKAINNFSLNIDNLTPEQIELALGYEPQEKLNEDNVGQFMDLELATKSTPTSGDTVLARDSLTGKAVEIPTSSFGGSGGGSGLVLGETSSTAYRGDRGKTAYDHSQATGNPHGTTKSDIGLGNVENTSDLNKPISTATQNALNSKQDKLQDATGNIGVGKTDASATEKLDVNGNVKANGFKTPNGTANQSLTANGGVFDLNTKADLVGGKLPKAQSQPSTMVMDNSTYVITFTDATGAVKTIDLPLESLFKDANYDAQTKSLIVTLQDGTNRTIPLTDLVDLPEIVLATTNPAVTPTTGQKVYFNTSLGKVWFNVSGVWVFGGNLISDNEKTNLSTAYDHSQVTGNPHGTTKSDIGLGNVDNTSDLNKPISTATQLALNTKADINDIPTKTSFTHDILVSNWTLVGGKYEAVISNAGILANSFVDVIPSNDHVDIVRAAQIYPSVLISAGSVKVYSKFLPSGTISVTVNIN